MNSDNQYICPYCASAIATAIQCTRILLKKRTINDPFHNQLILQGTSLVLTLKKLIPLYDQVLARECSALQEEVRQAIPESTDLLDSGKETKIDSLMIDRWLRYLVLLTMSGEDLNSKEVDFYGVKLVYPEAVILTELGLISKEDFKIQADVYQGYGNEFNPQNGHVKGLRLEWKKIDFFPNAIQFLPNLEDLNLAGIRAELPDWFGNLPLKKLYLDAAKFPRFPEVISRMKTLEYLTMGLTELPIPDSIGDLRELRHFAWGYNGAPHLPDSIGNLTKLKVLFLHKNNIATIPASFVNLQQLEDATITVNQLRTLPEFMTKLKSLKQLHVYDNPLSSNLDKTSKEIIKQLKKQGVEVWVKRK